MASMRALAGVRNRLKTPQSFRRTYFGRPRAVSVPHPILPILSPHNARQGGRVVAFELDWEGAGYGVCSAHHHTLSLAQIWYIVGGQY